MDFRSKRVWFGIAAGMAINLVMAWLNVTCLTVVLGAVVALSIGQNFNLRQGAAVGALVLLPLAVLAAQVMQSEGIIDFTYFPLGSVLGLLVAFLTLAAVGAITGMLIALAFRAVKARQPAI